MFLDALACSIVCLKRLSKSGPMAPQKGWVAGAERPEWLKNSLRSGHVEITENLGMVLVVRAGKAPVSSFEVEAYALVFAEGRWRDC